MKSIIAIVFVSSMFSSSIYTKKITTLTGTEIAMSLYQGKRILIVNIATNSPFAATQLPKLEHLYQTYKDSLTVIAFPSIDFGNEPRTDTEIKQLLVNTYHITFPVSVRTGVKDSTANTHPIYKWLQNATENGSMNIKVKKDFQKYLIDKNGSLIGVFSGKTNPMDSTIIKAITQ